MIFQILAIVSAGWLVFILIFFIYNDLTGSRCVEKTEGESEDGIEKRIVQAYHDGYNIHKDEVMLMTERELVLYRREYLNKQKNKENDTINQKDKEGLD